MFKNILLVLFIFYIGCSGKTYMPNVKNILSIQSDSKNSQLRNINVEMQDGSKQKITIKAGKKIIYNSGNSKLEIFRP